jgi:glucose-1-phosphate thymidylyltransferase
MKGIILAGGRGSRLRPLTVATSKQLLPVYDKPLIYYPLSTLILAGIREILIIVTPEDKPQFEKLLGNGSQWGVKIKYAIQETPRGVAEALIIGEEFIGTSRVCLILGDNIFFGSGMGRSLERLELSSGAVMFTQRATNIQRYGVVELDSQNTPISIEEKPTFPKSDMAITGLYAFPHTAVMYAKTLEPSNRGELEITDLLDTFLRRSLLDVEILPEEVTWLDVGTIGSLSSAASKIFALEQQLGRKINVPEEVAWRKGFVSLSDVLRESEKFSESGYGDYLRNVYLSNKDLG